MMAVEYKYIVDVSRVEQIIELFREFVIQRDNRHVEEPSRCIEYIRKEERYRNKMLGALPLKSRNQNKDATINTLSLCNIGLEVEPE